MVEWRILKGLLPIEPENRGRGRGRHPEQNRYIINGILWQLRCGLRGVTFRPHTAVVRLLIGDSSAGKKAGWEAVAIDARRGRGRQRQYSIYGTSIGAHAWAAH
ncbi:transposase [Sphingobium limneticum]|jgi:hypothetical protein|uniref:Transposase n=1 Tax=Sphingobium limneticum TaxID=1007511 RepID=A0A5J5I731_9SPHN|nr:transposase [Sphingobium limneticum]KAA9032283.1 transposase [Sphingobium limneticum]